MPSDDVTVFATLDLVAVVIARDDDARRLLARLCEIGVEVGGPNAQPTVTMLRAVLDDVGFRFERARLEEFKVCGSLHVISRGSAPGGVPS